VIRPAIALCVGLAGAPAGATPLDLPKTRATIDVPASWSATATPPAPEIVVGYRSPSGSTLAVIRSAVPNASAWIPKSRKAYVAEVERGALAAEPGLRKRSSKLIDAHGIPALDLELRRKTGATLVIRILLYRTYALAATIEVPAGGSLAEARTIIAGFMQPAEKS